MASTTFTDFQTTIVAAWLNDVNTAVYGTTWTPYFGATTTGNLTVMGNTTVTGTLSASGLATVGTGTSAGGIAINGGTFQAVAAQGFIYSSAANGMVLTGQGTGNDLTIVNKNGVTIATVPTGTTNFTVTSGLTVGSAAVLTGWSSAVSDPGDNPHNISFSGNGSNSVDVALSLGRANPTLSGSGNDSTDGVGLWIGGFYQGIGGQAPLYLGRNFTGTSATATISSTGLAVTGAFTTSTGFGCNGKAAQPAYASGGVLANVVAALIANGILSS